MMQRKQQQASPFAIAIAVATLSYSLDQMLASPISSVIAFSGGFLLTLGAFAVYVKAQQVTVALKNQEMLIKELSAESRVTEAKSVEARSIYE